MAESGESREHGTAAGGTGLERGPPGAPPYPITSLALPDENRFRGEAWVDEVGGAKELDHSPPGLRHPTTAGSGTKVTFPPPPVAC